MRVICGVLAAVFAAPLCARAAGQPETGGFSITVGEPPAGAGAQSEIWRGRVERARRRYEAYAARAYRNYLIFSGAPLRDATAARMDSTLAPILNDPTLRRDDIYVAEDGFLVFRGASGPPYLPDDFRRMPEARAGALSLKINLQPK